MSIASIVNLVAGKIGELLVEEAKFLYGVRDQVRSLQEEFTMMQSFLIDMEAMDEEGGDERSRTTIKQIRKIAYDAEDVIESYILEASNPSADKTGDLFKRYLCFCISLPHTHQIGSDIAVIKARIVEIMESIEDHVVGLDEDIHKLVAVLTSDEEYAEFKVVSFVGMGGSGKTTLARKLWPNFMLKKQFVSTYFQLQE